MKILFTICGRAGSKGIVNKNIRKFCRKYLAHFTISALDLYLSGHPEVDADIVGNSDSEELLEVLEDNGMRPVERIVRDESLAGDSIRKMAVINDCHIKMKERKGKVYDMVIDLDITSPLRLPKDIEKVIETHIRTGADVTTTVAAARRNPYFNQIERTEHGFKKVIEADFTGRQQAPEVFDMNASIYVYRPEYLCDNKSVLDGYCEAVEMYDTGILDLDHENDFELMQVIAEYLIKTHDGFREVYEHIPE